MRRIFQADSQGRARVLVLFAIPLLVGGLGLVLASQLLGDYTRASDLPDAASAPSFGPLVLLAWAAAWGVTAATILAAYVLVRLSISTWRTGTFPPPGTRTLRPVPIVTGPAARQRAVGGIMVGVLLTGLSIMLPILMTTLVDRLLA
jgi:hypothetical protein